MVERHFVEDFSDYKGRTLRLKVKEIDREKNKVILSQKDVLDEEFEANKQRISNSIQVGQEIDGTVQRLTRSAHSSTSAASMDSCIFRRWHGIT